MPSPLFVTIASGFAVSSRFTLLRPERTHAVFCASAAAQLVTVAFATSSGGTLLPLRRNDGSGLVHVVCSGTEGVSLITPPSPWFVIQQAAATTDTRTIVVTVA